MDFTWKKLLAFVLVFIAIFASPIFLLSNFMMEFYQKKIEESPNTDLAKWTQMKMADICYKTMRPEMAAESYRKFYDRYENDERRPRALIRYGMSIEDCHKNKEAIEAYEKYIEDYPEGEFRVDAQRGIIRCRYVNPNR